MLKSFAHFLKRIAFDMLSLPIRLRLVVYPLSTNELIDKRKKCKFSFTRMAYNSALYRLADIPETVKMGGVNFVHNSYGTVIHPFTTIGNYSAIIPFCP